MAGIGLPYPRKRRQEKGVRIEVMADSMRVGKSTAVKVLAEGMRRKGHQVTESYEDWEHNPYLTKSYEDPAKNFLESQKWFIRRKWEQVREGVRFRQGSGEVNVFIQDVSPEMDYCYAETNRRLGRMSEEHFAEYEKFFHSLDWQVVPAPTVMVYLSASDEVLLQRAIDSKREFEVVEPEYYLTMKRVNREWLAGAREKGEYRVVEIDTDILDYANGVEAKDELIEKIWGLLQ